MRGVMIHAPGDIRVEDRPDPVIEEPTDAIIRMAATCICGSDLWPYRGYGDISEPAPMGHEYVGVVEHIGADVKNLKVGDFVIGSFFASDNTCEICQDGYQSRCVNNVGMGGIGTQSEYARIPLADGTLVATPSQPTDEQIPHLLAASDVLGTGWFAAVAAGVGPGKTVAVVGDGAVGLSGVLAAKQLGAERIIAMSRHKNRQALATKFGATDIVEERGDDGVESPDHVVAVLFGARDASVPVTRGPTHGGADVGLYRFLVVGHFQVTRRDLSETFTDDRLEPEMSCQGSGGLLRSHEVGHEHRSDWFAP